MLKPPLSCTPHIIRAPDRDGLSLRLASDLGDSWGSARPADNPNIHNLLGGWANPSEKYYTINWDDESQLG